MRKIVKKSVTIALGCTIILGAVLFQSTEMTVLAADPYLDYGWPSASVSVKSYSSSYNDTWVNILNSGRSAWNSSSAPTWISTSSTSGNVIEAAQYSDSWYGLTTQTYSTSTGNTTKFTIKVNARTISDNAANFNNFAKSTVAHEFGHVFWLCDNPNTTSSSLMKYSRDRNSMTTPQSFDINNVKAKYN